jgi:hypothetical protein
VRALSRKGAVLFGVVMAICAVSMPQMASGASWGLIGTTHVLDSSNFGFVSHTAIGSIAVSCPSVQFHADVASAALLRITGAAFRHCTGFQASGDCTVTANPTFFPWAGTGTTTSNIQLHNIHIDLRFDTVPGAPAGSCVLENQNMTITGTWTGGDWDPAAHQMTYLNDVGLVAHSVLGTSTVTASGAIRDTSQTLTLF